MARKQTPKTKPKEYTKRCSKCLTVQPINNFHTHQAWCKNCLPTVPAAFDEKEARRLYMNKYCHERYKKQKEDKSLEEFAQWLTKN